MKTYHIHPPPHRAVPVDDPAVDTRPADAPAGAARRRPTDYAPDIAQRPLSRKQKARLCILARQAAEQLGAPQTGPAHHQWRHDQAIAACGHRISAARQAHWADLHAWFVDRAGRADAAFTTLMRADDNPRRIAMHKLREALTQRGLAEAYAAAICQRQNKCPLHDASAPQLWRLLFTVRNRRKPQRT